MLSGFKGFNDSVDASSSDTDQETSDRNPRLAARRPVIEFK
jgi:hypothetical protein